MHAELLAITAARNDHRYVLESDGRAAAAAGLCTSAHLRISARMQTKIAQGADVKDNKQCAQYKIRKVRISMSLSKSMKYEQSNTYEHTHTHTHTVYSILISQPTANITPLKQLFCTSTITTSVQWDHRKYHASAYSTSLLLSTLLTMTS